MAKITVFYSWQSNSPNSTNRGFIQEALKKAIKSLNTENRGREIVIDQDTLGEKGSPDIVDTILAKIDKSKAFVCDISIINPNARKYRTPNPNVLFELGYAVKSLGWDRIIMICNEAFGSIENLPFDIRGRRIFKYNVKEEEQDKSLKRKILEGYLTSSLAKIKQEEPTFFIGGGPIITS